jgi:hypothetical protein
MAALEDEEKAGRFQDNTTKKGVHTYHPFVISCPWSFNGIVHNLCRESLILFGEMSHLLLQGHTAGRPQVLGCRVGVFVHPISIGSTRRSCLYPQIRIETRVSRRIVLVSLSQPAIICLLKIKKNNNQIQFKKIITYERKWFNEHTMKCWVWLSMNCCTPFWWSSLRARVSTKSLIGLRSRPKDVACKKKILEV